MTNQLKIERIFTKELEANSTLTVYDLIHWSKRDVLLKDYKTGQTIVEMSDLEFPEQYSQQACDIIASKYFRKAGLDTPQGYETSMRQVAHRLVGFWVGALLDEKVITTEAEAQILYDELVYAFLMQMFAPNSPQWFNTGLKFAYGIKGGKSQLYYYDENLGKVVESEDDYTRTQASACFILSIEDKLLGPHSISEEYVTETKLFKGGSGTGTNFSNIRGAGERLSGGGESSGLMSFLKGLDRNAGAIKSGGTTRRAAKMVSLDIDHPEIEEFITWKAHEEDKVIALTKMGYDGDIDGEAYQTVSGQNSNNSVRLSDDFMRKVATLEQDAEQTITLRGRLDSGVNREVKVSSLWHQINKAAWRCADPAPQFDDTFNVWHTCPYGEDGNYNAPYNRINATNPCGEYAFLDDTSCNLASINVLQFINQETGAFQTDRYLHLVALCQLVLEASIHWGQFPTPDIARKTYLFRTTGLGLANLASLFMVMGLPYDSDEARAVAGALAGLLTGQSYATSSHIAAIVGAFAKYNLNQDAMMRVIQNHRRAAGVEATPAEGLNYELPSVNHQLLATLGFGELSTALATVWNDALQSGTKYGYRNAQVSVMAPTGTISFAMDCASTSIEPFFSHVVYKKLVGGGFMKLVNPMVEAGLKRLGYSEIERQDILEYVMREENGMIIDGKIEGAPHLKEADYAVFDTANQCGSGKRYINYMGHVRMVAAITPLISGAISKTVNLPQEATEADFADVLLQSWKLGVKGITLYRDGSKFAQPLNIRLNEDAGQKPLEDLSYADLLTFAAEAKAKVIALEQRLDSTSRGVSSIRQKPEGVRYGCTHPAQIEDVKIYTTVNRNSNNDITEIYITTDREGTLIMGLLNSLSKTISVMLQYGIPPKDIAKMLRGQKYEPYGFVTRHPNIKYCSSISDLISKIIDIEVGDYTRVQVRNLAETNQVKLTDNTIENAKTIHSGEKLYDGSVCSNCSSTRMVKNGTCKVCLDCGTTTGCS